ncbi:Regulatory protein UhpC [Piscirickettsia salmonis]|uniref:Lysosomal dipeptide transporter MFSD1 n=2 Tax=Piscirickettsia salmonis TaxID=1238 RepID=A0A1L6TGK9_PISSA|nr:MFS transporter [Piscirickettsia salmonis]AKP72879.1 MFS transporter [Piscirickettsia salmonis LF-89 = ATCC VR-1361]ALB21498.1 MFS transporter [Piscirickettsia salmonis]ALY01718.1 MFS transporter [Piscirickettsia salmonis]AMA41234.1 MFS transporter [Piscirickettsia salmonis]AOS36423.1 MFS transporter [Piscirickettsia salmonis]
MNQPTIIKSTLISWFIIALGAIFYMYEYYLRISPGVMIPELMHYFNVGATSVGTFAGFYFYAYTPMQLIVGPLFDRFRAHQLLTLAVIACALGTILTGIAPTDHITIAYAGRFLQGFGSAFAFVGILKLGATILPHNRLALIAGLVTCLGFVGAMAGQNSLAALVTHFNWQPVLITIGLFGFILAPIFFFFVHNPHSTPTDHTSQQMSSKDIFQGFLLTIKQPYLWLVGLAGGALFMPNSVFASLWGIPFLTQTHHLSTAHATFATSLIFLGWAIGSPLQGWLSDRLRTARLQLIFVNILIAATIIYLVIAIPGLNYTLLCILLLAFGIFASAEIAVFPLAIEHMPTQYSGTAIAFVNFLTMLGGLTMQRGIGEILDLEWDGTLSHGIRVYSSTVYSYALYTLPLILLIAAVCVIFAHLIKTKTKSYQLTVS